MITTVNLKLFIKHIQKINHKTLEIGDFKQLFPPKLSNGFWFILRKDNVLKAEFNQQQKIKLSLELGEKFLNDKFIENQLNKKI